MSRKVICIPPFMTPFVLIADIDRAVMDVTTVVVRINKIDSPTKKTKCFAVVLTKENFNI